MHTANSSFAPGCYVIPNSEYQAAEGVSKSQLDHIDSAPIDYWSRYLDPDRKQEEKSDSLILGDAVHDAILQPDLFTKKWMKLPDLNLRTKAGREERDAFLAAHPGASILSVDDYATALAARDAVFKHPHARPLVDGGESELSFFSVDPEFGCKIKCRTDKLHESQGLIVDLKTTDDASDAGFAKSIAKYRYFVQQPWYEDVIESLYGEAPPYWAWLAVEKKPPYKIGIYYLEPDDIALGRTVARANLAKLMKYRQANLWPDYSSETGIRPIRLPGWFRRTIGP